MVRSFFVAIVLASFNLGFCSHSANLIQEDETIRNKSLVNTYTAQINSLTSLKRTINSIDHLLPQIAMALLSFGYSTYCTTNDSWSTAGLKIAFRYLPISHTILISITGACKALINNRKEKIDSIEKYGK